MYKFFSKSPFKFVKNPTCDCYFILIFTLLLALSVCLFASDFYKRVFLVFRTIFIIKSPYCCRSSNFIRCFIMCHFTEHAFLFYFWYILPNFSNNYKTFVSEVYRYLFREIRHGTTYLSKKLVRCTFPKAEHFTSNFNMDL